MLAVTVLHLFAGNRVDMSAAMISLEIAQDGHRHLKAVLFLVADAREIGDIGIGDGQPGEHGRLTPTVVLCSSCGNTHLGDPLAFSIYLVALHLDLAIPNREVVEGDFETPTVCVNQVARHKLAERH